MLITGARDAIPQLATISVVSHGHGKLLDSFLRDLERQDDIASCRIVVTLNLASEAFSEADYRLNLLVIRNGRPKGFGDNHNAAFAHRAGDWFVIANPDIRLPEVRTLRTLLSAAPALGLRAPLVVNPEGHREDSVRSNLSLWALLRRALRRERAPLNPRAPARLGAPFYWFAGMFLAVPSRAYAEVGGFDPRFFLYCEDYDLCARLYLAGHALTLDTASTVVHDARRDSHRSLRHLRWHIASLVAVWSSSAFWRIVRSQRRHHAPSSLN